MTSKICWIDTETSGLDFVKCCILQLAVLIEVDGNIKDEFVVYMKPNSNDLIVESALEIHGIKKEQFDTYESQSLGYMNLSGRLNSVVNKYDKYDKLVFAAYNAGFDDQFLRQLFLRNNDKYYGSYFFWPKIDVQSFLARAISKGLRLPNYKLSTVCEHYGIPIEAHDALSDIKATRELYYKLRSDSCQ